MLYCSNDHNELSQIMMKLLLADSKDFASYYAANAPAVEDYYNSVIEQYKALE